MRYRGDMRVVRRLAVLFFAVLILARLNANAQPIRYDNQSTTTNSSCSPGKQCPVMAIPGAQINFCTTAGFSTLAACMANPLPTFTDSTGMTSCPTTAQLVPATGGACLSTSDNQGAFGVWFTPQTAYYYLRVPATAGGGTYGPYPFSFGVNGQASGVTYRQGGTGSVTRTSSAKFQERISVQDFGAFANGRGTSGTDQSIAVNAAMSVINGIGGGFLDVVPATDCYTINPGTGTNAIQAYSNITINIPSGACFQQGPVSNGSHEGLIGNGGVVTPAIIHDFHVIGPGTLDGNRANITPTTDFGGFVGIQLFACSNCSVEGLTIKNWLGDGIFIDGTGSGFATCGNNIKILNNSITYSQRDNISLICGTNVDIEGNECAYATDVSPGVGGLCIDVEEDGAGQYVTGLKFNNNMVHHNVGQGVVIQPFFDLPGALTVQSHGNNSYLNGCQGYYYQMSAQNGQKIDIQGDIATDNDVGGTGVGGTCGSEGFHVFGWNGGCSIGGVTSSGSNTGLQVSAKSSCVIGPSPQLSGVDFDAAVDAFSIMNFTVPLTNILAHGTCGGCSSFGTDIFAPTKLPLTFTPDYCNAPATGATASADCHSASYGVGSVSNSTSLLNLQTTSVTRTSTIQVTLNPGLIPTIGVSCGATIGQPYIAHQGGGTSPRQQAGNVTTSGTAVTNDMTGDPFDASWAGDPIVIAGTPYTIQTVNSATSITLTGSAGTHTSPVAYTYQPNFTIGFSPANHIYCFNFGITN